jgi:Ferritin-like domain
MINGYRIDSHSAFPFIRRRRHPPTNSQHAFLRPLCCGTQPRVGRPTPELEENTLTFLRITRRSFGAAQTFEDTGVAAFKGRLLSLTGQGEALTTALKIHSVEARHAAEVRQLRAERAWVGTFDKPMTKEQVLAVAKPFFAH